MRTPQQPKLIQTMSKTWGMPLRMSLKLWVVMLHMTASGSSKLIQTRVDRENEICEKLHFGKCPPTGDARQGAFQSPNEAQNTWMERPWSPCLAAKWILQLVGHKKRNNCPQKCQNSGFPKIGCLGAVWRWHSIDLLRSSSYG